ncbi:MAG: hypothetical protein QM802_17370 [Agriterribacter sp.]
MGLDSVELLMDIENFFEIRIPNKEAEKIATIQDMVDTVAHHLNITANEKTLRDKVFKQILPHILQLSNKEIQPGLNDLIADYLDVSDKAKWLTLEKLVQMSLPIPALTNYTSSKSWFKKYVSRANNYDWKEITVEQFIDAVCANNYQKLIDPAAVKSKYEIYICVMRITVDKAGVDYYEILPHKSFTSDLGID